MDMKRRRTISEKSNVIYNGKSVIITKEKNQELFFEIQNNNITTDLAEAVSIMMRLDIKDDNVWKVEIENKNNIIPDKALYWLSGGDKEWITMEHYSTSWVNCYLDFCEKYSKQIVEIVESSKTLGEIRDKFNRYLNLPIIYNFALSKGFVK